MDIFENIVVKNLASGQGILARFSAKVISRTNIDLSLNLVGLSIDSIVLVDGDRILLSNQTTSTQNGVYVVNSGAGNTKRSDDFRAGDSVSGIFITIISGNVYSFTEWQVVQSPAIVGTNSLNFVQKNNLSYTTGDLFFPNSSNTKTKLGKPLLDSVLKMNSSGLASWLDVSTISNIYNSDGTISSNRTASIVDKILNFTFSSGNFSLNGPTMLTENLGLIAEKTSFDGEGGLGIGLYRRIDNGGLQKSFFINFVGDYWGDGINRSLSGYLNRGDISGYNIIEAYDDRVDISSGNIYTGDPIDSCFVRVKKGDNKVYLNATNINLLSLPPAF